jgi:ribosomal-protein-alanine N-acetyltransferase
MSVVTTTPRITIREYLPGELETYLKHFTDEKVALYIPKRSRDERIVIFNNALKNYRETKFHGMWGMFNSINDEFIGGCLLRPYDNEPNVLEIGYSLEHKYWGQGIATEMVKALVQYGFNNADVKAIVACAVVANIASQRVLEKVGFTRAENIVKNGEELTFFRLSR